MQQALQEVRAGRTTFVIAHRLWTVQHADQILVIEQGRIVERAHSTPARSAHQALLDAGGVYQTLFELQFRGEALADAAPSARDPVTHGSIAWAGGER